MTFQAVSPPPFATSPSAPGEVSVKFAHVVRVGRTKMQRLLELLDPQRAVGHVAADALVPLMFWLGLTKSRTAALETLRSGHRRGPGKGEGNGSKWWNIDGHRGKSRGKRWNSKRLEP